LVDTGGIHTSSPEALLPRLSEIGHAQQLGVDNQRRLARRRGTARLLCWCRASLPLAGEDTVIAVERDGDDEELG
jgi:hypothetical protein